MSTYIFIDGGYLTRRHSEQTKRWFGRCVPINFLSVVQKLKSVSFPPNWMSMGDSLQPVYLESKSFYYDCLEKEKKSNEDESAFNARLREQDLRLKNLRRVEGCHIRLGALKGSKKREQKEVDVLIAVDMLLHAAQKNMSKAILLAGDQDFKPAVEALVQLGIYVHIVSDPDSTSKELTWAASEHTELSFDDFYDWTDISIQKQYALPESGKFKPKSIREMREIKEGFLNGNNCKLFRSESGFIVYFQRFGPPEEEQYFLHSDLERLEAYLEMRYGTVKWNEMTRLE